MEVFRCINSLGKIALDYHRFFHFLAFNNFLGGGIVHVGLVLLQGLVTISNHHFIDTIFRRLLSLQHDFMHVLIVFLEELVCSYLHRLKF